MRMRTRGHLEDRIEACRGYIAEGFDSAGFSIDKPLHIEIGCGKGRFISELAAREPNINYIAVEKVSNVIVLAMEKVAAAGLENVRFMRGKFEDLSIGFPDKSVDRIYLNFSDPWPKKGYAKRRLTHGGFLDIYRRILKNGGEIHFKTDNRALFDYSLETFPENGFELSGVTFDLHCEYPEGNVMTEYEERFSSEGFPICRLIARVKR